MLDQSDYLKHTKTHLNPKSHVISVVHIIFPTYPIVLIFCTEHGSDTAVLCPKHQNDMEFVLKRLDIWKRCYGWPRFHVTGVWCWVWDGYHISHTPDLFICRQSIHYTPVITRSFVSDILTIDTTLQWRHNGLDIVSNLQPHDCLLNRLFRRRSKKTSKLRLTGLCAGNSPGTDEFPAQMASNAENISISWRHHHTGCVLWIQCIFHMSMLC